MKFSILNFTKYHIANNFNDGKFAAGHNGLYFDPETPIRNTSHFACLISRIYKLKKDKELLLCLADIKGYFESLSNVEFTHQYRNKNGKDKSNGLIGTAWHVEGLLALYEVFNEEWIVDYAIRQYKLYSFNHLQGYWDNIIEPDGTSLPADRTLNHQIWFAAILAKLLKVKTDKHLLECLNIFCKKLNNNHYCFPNGRFYHTMKVDNFFTKTAVKRILKPDYRLDMKIKEVGYQGFNLLGLHILSNNRKICCASLNKIIAKGYSFTSTKTYKRSIVNNKYGSSYNPIEIELAVIDSLNSRGELAYKRISSFIDKFFPNGEFESTGTPDNKTLNARIYELVYLQDHHFLDFI